MECLLGECMAIHHFNHSLTAPSLSDNFYLAGRTLRKIYNIHIHSDNVRRKKVMRAHQTDSQTCHVSRIRRHTHAVARSGFISRSRAHVACRLTRKYMQKALSTYIQPKSPEQCQHMSIFSKVHQIWSVSSRKCHKNAGDVHARINL